VTGTVSDTQRQISRLRWLIQQGAKNAGIEVSSHAIIRLAQGMWEEMREQHIYLEWESALDPDGGDT
jgi:hypothetical protein